MEVKLKANYKSNTYSIFDISTMQEMTSTLCANTTTPLVSATTSINYYSTDNTKVPEVTLRDTRDNNTYMIRKLADGNCWMISNLRIINKTIDSTNSDMTSGTWTAPTSSTSGFSSYNTNNAYLHATYGGYYTFYTATAGWGTSSVASGNSPRSICPKGWRLPTGGTSGEFQILYNKYHSPASMKNFPVSFIYAGYIRNSSMSSQGSHGVYWSSTPENSNNGFRLYLDTSMVIPEGSRIKNDGLCIRCVAR